MSVLSKLGVERRIVTELPKLMRDIGNDSGYAAKLLKIESGYKNWSLREKIALAYCIGKYSGAEAMIEDPISNEKALRMVIKRGSLSDKEIDTFVEEVFKERKLKQRECEVTDIEKV
jgi:hypothetical protein